MKIINRKNQLIPITNRYDLDSILHRDLFPSHEILYKTFTLLEEDGKEPRYIEYIDGTSSIYITYDNIEMWIDYLDINDLIETTENLNRIENFTNPIHSLNLPF